MKKVLCSVNYITLYDDGIISVDDGIGYVGELTIKETGDLHLALCNFFKKEENQLKTKTCIECKYFGKIECGADTPPCIEYQIKGDNEKDFDNFKISSNEDKQICENCERYFAGPGLRSPYCYECKRCPDYVDNFKLRDKNI